MKSRKFLSNSILLLFFILVSAAAIFSDLFQNPNKTGKQIIEQTKLFSKSRLSLIKKISLKNKSGEFVFERNENNLNSPWHMKAPKDITANSIFIEKLFTSLSDIKVKKFIADEKVNTTNFSLDKPTAELILFDQFGNSTVIHFGLMNSIDNSIYLKFVGKIGIYHVEAPTVSLEDATLIDLIQSQIITNNLNAIESFKIFKSNIKTAPPQLELTKKGKDWVDNLGIPLAQNKIDEYFQDLLSLSSMITLDKQTEIQKKQISTLLQKAEFTLVITDNKNISTEYIISAITQNISEIDLKNEICFVISTSNSPNIYVVKKEFIELFNKKTEAYKPLLPIPSTENKK